MIVLIEFKFLDGHILNEDPTVPNSYKSWNGDSYYFTDNKIEPMPLTNCDKTTGYNARILFREQSLNNEYRTYTILILDKPINPTDETIENVISLDQNIICYKEWVSVDQKNWSHTNKTKNNFLQFFSL